jgi:hypothetical protein
VEKVASEGGRGMTLQTTMGHIFPWQATGTFLLVWNFRLELCIRGCSYCFFPMELFFLVGRKLWGRCKKKRLNLGGAALFVFPRCASNINPKTVATPSIGIAVRIGANAQEFIFRYLFFVYIFQAFYLQTLLF